MRAGRPLGPHAVGEAVYGLDWRKVSLFGGWGKGVPGTWPRKGACRGDTLVCNYWIVLVPSKGLDRTLNKN